MIYCNYDQLQHKFSKTYRKIKPNECSKEIGERHRNFWWMGKWLKEFVNGWGERDKQSLYHGVSGKMSFTTTVHAKIMLRALYIYGPVSTSCALAVAINFANADGMVIEFSFGRKNPFAWCLSCEWLSDFPYEKEYLFLQRKIPFKIKAILDTRLEIDYSFILNALGFIHQLIQGNDKFARVEISNTMKYLIREIIFHQLSFMLNI